MSMDFEACLEVLARHRTEEVVIMSMTPNSYWPFLSKSDRDLHYTDPMGSVPAVSLGLALARPEVRVWGFDGDGGHLMYLGSLVTIAEQAPANLVHFVFDNEKYGLVGLPTPGVGKRDFGAIARGAGLREVHRFDDLEELDGAMPAIKTASGPVYVVLRVEGGHSSDAKGMEQSRARRNAPEVKQRYGRMGARTLRRLFE